MSLTVKAYLYKGKLGDPEGAEIRRFVIDQDVSSNFEYLSKKLIHLFPNLTPDNFSVYWKDEEGDFVAFSSDDELMQALGYLNEQVFRVHLTAHIQPKGDGSEGEVHPNVVCDGCNSGVVGVRFKCVQCPDYDLCSTCANNGLHSEHEMIRFCKPIQWPFMGPPPAGPWGGPHHGPGRHGPHGPHGPGPHGPGPHGPGPHGPWGPGAGPQHWGRWMRRCMRQMWRGMQGAEGQKGEEKDGADEPMKEGTDVDPTPDERKIQDEYLRSIGENVAAMLDPMGIDVQIDVENPEGARIHCGQRQGAQCGPGRREFMRQMMGGQFPGQGFKCGKGKGRGQKCGKKMTDKADKEKLVNENDVENDENVVEIEVEKPMETKPADASKTPSTDEPMEDSVDGPASPAKKGSDSECEWTVINKDAPEPASDDRDRQPYQFSFINKDGAKETVPSQVDPAPAPQPMAPEPTAPEPTAPSTSGANIYPTIPAPQQEHPNTRVAEALHQMQGMGFSNDGGWLSQLLESKNGDIARVLDTLQPARRN